MRTGAREVFVLGLVLLFVGCHKLLGDYTLEASCPSGDVQCVGNVLQRCNKQGTAWDNVSVCASETLCDEAQALCQLPTCAGGERRCEGAELEICNPTRDGWSSLEPCSSAAHCSGATGTCTDQPCAAGFVECNSAVVRSCNDDGSGWTDRETCGSAALCNASESKCDDGTCVTGEYRCDGAELKTCNDMLDGWTPVQTCDSAALCDKTTGTCGTAGCTTPGAFRCSDAGLLETCDDSLTGWMLEDTCLSAAHCDAVNGVCMEMPCTQGSRQCSGETLQECKADSSGWDAVATCETEGLCQQSLAAGAAGCAEPACAANDTRCLDGQPQICSADRTGFRNNGAACLTVELCNSGSGTCATPICEPNATDCVDAQPLICNPGLTGFESNGPPCPSAALCNRSTGTCGDEQCVEGQLRCDPENPTALQRCNADHTDWETEPCDTCETPELCSASLGAQSCDESSCQEPVCEAGQPDCGGSGTDQGRVLQMCNAGRTGYTTCETCATSGLCELSLAANPFSCTETACTPPSCSPSDRWCGGSGNLNLYQCPPSRINSEPNLLDTCATAGLCSLTHQNGGTECVAPSCALTDLWCGGSGNRDLYQCPPSRINSEGVVLATCATSALCEQAHDAGDTSCPAPACDPGDTECGGTGTKTLRMCNADQTGFMDCDTCATAELCSESLDASDCDTGACLACLEGEARCTTAGDYETCNSAHTGFDVTDCEGNGCDEAMGGCLAAGIGGMGGVGGVGGSPGTGGSGGVGAATGTGGTGASGS